MEREGSTSGAAPGGDYDDEPVLKYQRMGADVGRLLSSGGGNAADNAEADGEGKKGKEAVVRMLVHDTCLVGCYFFGVPQALGVFLCRAGGGCWLLVVVVASSSVLTLVGA